MGPLILVVSPAVGLIGLLVIGGLSGFLFGVTTWLLIALPFNHFMGRRDPFGPFVITSVAFVYYFVLGSLYLELFGTSHGEPARLAPLYAAVLAGYLAYAMGYHLNLGGRLARKIPSSPWGIDTRRLGLFAVVLLAVSLAAALAQSTLAESSASGVAHNLASILVRTSNVALVMMLVVGLRLGSARWLTLTAAAAISVGVAIFLVVEVERRDLLSVLIALTVCWHYTRRRIPVAAVLGLAMVGMGLIFVLKNVQQFYRYSHQDWGIELFREVLQLRTERYGTIFSVAQSYESPGAVERASQIFERVGWGARREAFLGGGSYLQVLLAPIPRSIWPDKPEHLGRRVTEVTETAYLGVAAPATMLAEAYWNFGYLGILAVMFVFGIGTKGLYRWLAPSYRGAGPSVEAIVLYSATAPSILLFMRSSFYLVALNYIVAVVIPFVVGMYLCRRRSEMQLSERAG